LISKEKPVISKKITSDTYETSHQSKTWTVQTCSFMLSHTHQLYLHWITYVSYSQLLHLENRVRASIWL